MDYYDHAVAGFVNVDCKGIVATSTIVPWNLSGYKKVIYVYTDNTYDYIFIYSPNYNDNWYVDVLTAYNVSLSWTKYTSTEFQNFIADKTLVSQSS